MFKIIVIIYSIVFLASFIFSYGISFAFWQKEFPTVAKERYKKDKIFSILLSLLISFIWPVGLILLYYFFDKLKFGLKFR